jgi:heterotetrameric sarcosine oxidase gamma subunit
MSTDAPLYGIVPVAPTRVLEFVAYQWPLSGFTRPDWPVDPGGVQSGARQQPALLHFAPGRWLAPAPDAGLGARLEAAAARGAGTLVDVSGKWVGLELSGPGAARLLAFTVDIEAVLAGRDCAAVNLLDCPAIVVRAAPGFRLWVQSSYAGHFHATARQCGEVLRARQSV